MSKIFKTSYDKSGFRLQYMEILNWGTFHSKQIFSIAPKGNNSLLTGANGSGKTTFIDALITLLIPAKNDRFYNQSSGVLKKGDRTEESYVLGHYGDIQKEGELSSSSQKLRGKDTFSILLASFSDKNNNTVTLFQVRWFSSGGLQREFGVAHVPLHIKADFLPFDAQGKWKKALTKTYNEGKIKNEIQFIKKVGVYGDRIVKLFGMRSKNALKLFNQIVGIKVLGDLNEFIRNNMLEKKNAEKKYIELKESFINLTNAKNDIDKAQEQIIQLTPINKAANRLKEIRQKLIDLEKNKKIAVYWFAKKGKSLATEEKEKLKDTLKIVKQELTLLKTEAQNLESKKEDLMVQIKTDQIGRQIEDLKKEILFLEKERDKRINKSEEYKELSQELNFNIVSEQNTFLENQKLAKEKIIQVELEKEAKEEQQYELKKKEESLLVQIKEAEEQIRFLLANKSNISGRVAQIRDEILANIRATKKEIPFIGELIKVNENQKDWEQSIEKVLHNFALQLIVPEKYYQQVNQYVNKTNLKGRIIYQRYKGFLADGLTQNSHFDKEELINKISFKSDNAYKDWLEYRVKKQFNYTCVNNLGEFHSLEKAITKEGLIKFGRGKHEKDDRKHILSKENYVLGWDNQEKLTWWKAKFKELQTEQKTNVGKLREIKRAITKIENLSKNYTKLLDVFSEFDQIDWQTYAKNRETKVAEKTKLEKSNDKLRVLQNQLKTVKEHLEKNQDKKEQKGRKVFSLEAKIEKVLKEVAEYMKLVMALLDKIPDLSSFEMQNKQLLAINYGNFSKLRSVFYDKIANSIKEFEDENNRLTNQTLSKMRSFRKPNKYISEQYKNWNADVGELSDDDIDFVSEYQDLYAKLVAENLPKFQVKFNEYLKEIIEGEVAMFRTFFSTWQEEIEENIGFLNEALAKIDYPSNYFKKAYIQLLVQNNYTNEIKELRKLLNNAISNIGELNSSAEQRKQHFEKNIEPLIKKLNDEKWRNKVLDVRSWFVYKVTEVDRESKQKYTYEKMGQLSGGEKAKLTYTILASAIAYQFSLTKEGQNKSFRFIAIDEAFKAQDEKNSGYLIELCKQLELQLLVVTPSDNIHIVEKEISFVHFVERRSNSTSWLYDMPIKEFQDIKEKFVKQDQ